MLIEGLYAIMYAYGIMTGSLRTQTVNIKVKFRIAFIYIAFIYIAFICIALVYITLIYIAFIYKIFLDAFFG